MAEHALLPEGEHVSDLAEVAEECRVDGTVKWFDAVRGYGFIVPSDGSGDVLVHFSTLREVGRRTLPEGATVVCMAVARERGRQARRIIELDLTTAIGPDLTRGEDSHDIFVHMETVRRAGLIELIPGQYVMARIAEGDKGPLAVAITAGEA